MRCVNAFRTDPSFVLLCKQLHKDAWAFLVYYTIFNSSVSVKFGCMWFWNEQFFSKKKEIWNKHTWIFLMNIETFSIALEFLEYFVESLLKLKLCWLSGKRDIFDCSQIKRAQSNPEDCHIFTFIHSMYRCTLFRCLHRLLFICGIDIFILLATPKVKVYVSTLAVLSRLRWIFWAKFHVNTINWRIFKTGHTAKSWESAPVITVSCCFRESQLIVISICLCKDNQKTKIIGANLNTPNQQKMQKYVF